MTKIAIYILLLLATLAFGYTALAAGIQVSPARLDFTVFGNRQASQTLTVVNPTDNVQLFEVYPDDFTEQIKTMPTSFTLEAGAKKTVTITVLPQQGNTQNSGQILSTNLSIVGKPLDSSQPFSVGTGVKIPLNVILSPGQTGPFDKQKQEAIVLFAAGIIIAGLWSVYIHKISDKIIC
jgi:hypothetical protein